MNKVQLVVFDIAGTTVLDGGNVAIAFAQAMGEHGYTIAKEEVNPLMGYKKPVAIRMLLDKYEPNPAKISEGLIHSIHDRFVELMINYYKTGQGVEPLPGVDRVFSYLKEKGVKIGLDTGFSKDIATAIVDRLGWEKEGKVDYIVASDEVPSGRPAPFMIQKMMDEAGISDPRQVVKIGDTEVDINEGLNAGCLFSIGVTTGAFTREELRKYHPTHIIDHMEELIPILESVN
ncbi:HAD-IA family hydrolase [Dinghuibacter silviterrae]|uniref:Phosphonoacetaldehyde hydrolase n=1 Tax=Dinghuibacter silviterrae TaxID=1539049 RepID=A0A4R8DU34_9BACT|nr:HAD-IA family hydrolase [Dinghuibacter silviterrae]TDX00651.1 phosphonoacetaldehyde hydrolase [Dinghuibacter silviterrae]